MRILKKWTDASLWEVLTCGLAAFLRPERHGKGESGLIFFPALPISVS